jgi:glycosyltransferase involved in cell wall biosynthesis
MTVGFSLLTLVPGRVGGSETYVLGLLREFARGHGPERLGVLANRRVASAYGDHAAGPVSLHVVPSYRPGDRGPTRALAMAMARVRRARLRRDLPAGIEVMHYPLTVPLPETDAPRVVTLHDVLHVEMPQFFSRAERLYRRWAYDAAARGAAAVITMSEHAKARISEHLEIDPDRVHAIPHGVDHSRFHPDAGPGDAAALRPLDLPDRFVLYPGNLWPHKNHGRLLDALATSARDVELVLTGQDLGRRREVMAHAARLGVEDRVHHLGYLPADTLPALYRRALALVFPSLYEGFGAPVLEAMACGCPVAASTRGALAEVGDDAVLAFEPEDVTAMADAIGRVTHDEELRERLRARGLERAASFTWRAAAVAHWNIYRSAATSRA